MMRSDALTVASFGSMENSSAGGGGGGRRRFTHNEAESTVGGRGGVSVIEHAKNEELQLALDVEREVKPMRHLIGILQDMGFNGKGGNGNGNGTNDAVSSLLRDFQSEVATIEQRLQIGNGGENLLLHGSGDGGDGPSVPDDDSSTTNDDGSDGLPPGWITLEDPDSGDTYYANENTGETTWDRPAAPPKRNDKGKKKSKKEKKKEKKQRRLQMQQQTQQQGAIVVSGGTGDDSKLPPGWYGIIDPDSGDTYYTNDATGETTWDFPGEGNASVDDGARSAPIDQRAGVGRMNDSDGILGGFEHSNRSITVDGDDDTQDDDANLPDGWFSILDPDTGDTYYSNDVTGETTWDRPGGSANGSGGGTRDDDHSDDDDESSIDLTGSRQQVTGGGGGGGDDDDPDYDLLPGWYSIVDPDSGDEYYSNEDTGETSWDRPVDPTRRGTKSSTAASRGDSSKMGAAAAFDRSNNSLPSRGGDGGADGRDDRDDDEASTSIDDDDNEDDSDLPPGWFSIVDPDTRDTYYSNEVTGEVTWDRPSGGGSGGDGGKGRGDRVGRGGGADSSVLSDEDEHDSRSGGEEGPLPPGWFAAKDPDSGDTYYVDEETGETSWDRPQGKPKEKARERPQNSDTRGGDSRDSHGSSDDGSEDDGSLLSGWFPVTDPDSGETYYANEVTGETSWDKPRGGGKPPRQHSSEDLLDF